mmetsp:Transcript_4358/g.4476  ORF Transcript_4358/g.4476 Transcript_4358/m.4476 type:complete len:230 (-) Transcript_4358:378-1067(-)
MISKVKKKPVDANSFLPVLNKTNHVERSHTINSLIQSSDTKTLNRIIGLYGYDNDIEACGFGGATPLHQAAKVGDVNVLRLLLTYDKIDLDKLEDRRAGGYAALHYACKYRHPQIVEILLESGADPNIKTLCTFGETPLHICGKIGEIECGRMLIKGGANVDARDNLGHNPSFWAYSKHHDDMIKQLNLPPPASPSANEFYAILTAKNSGVAAPIVKKKKGKKGPTKKK